MIQKHKEGKMTYEQVRVWVEATYSINVKANTVGYHVRKALEEEKKRKAWLDSPDILYSFYQTFSSNFLAFTIFIQHWAFLF